jgi:hypothetical protein
LDSYSWYTFGTWEFDLRRGAGYLGVVDFFNWERRPHFDDDEEDKEGTDEEEDELQPPNLTEDEAMEMAIGNRKLDNHTQCDGLAVQL